MAKREADNVELYYEWNQTSSPIFSSLTITQWHEEKIFAHIERNPCSLQ
jgi:hypothetical protein